MATAAHQNATHRFVVLLRPSEKQRISDLAREENVSASEIVRRSIHAYDSGSGSKRDQQDLISPGDVLRRPLDSYETLEARIRKEEEEKMLKSGLTLLQDALQAVNESINHTNAKLDKLHLELKTSDLR